MLNCDICGNDKKSTKLYELEFWKDIKDTIFICDECLPIQEETNKKENIKMKRIELKEKDY